MYRSHAERVGQIGFFAIIGIIFATIASVAFPPLAVIIIGVVIYKSGKSIKRENVRSDAQRQVDLLSAAKVVRR